ncbi:MAG: hypothetical protein ABFD62_07195 [Syntrophaceae bacterium]
MSLNSANIDLVSEKIELDAFLSRCLELKAAQRGETPAEPAQTKRDTVEVLTEDAGEVGEGRVGPEPVFPRVFTPEPVERVEPLGPVEIVEPVRLAFEETPPVQTQAEEPPGESAAEAETEAAAPAVEDSPAVVPERAAGKEQEFDIVIEREAEAAPQFDITIPQAHFGPDDQLDDNQLTAPANEIVAEQPIAVPPETKTDARQDIVKGQQPKAEINTEIQDRSSLRKPSKNAAAIAYARKKERRKKRLLIALYMIIAFVLGVEAFLYIFPNAGYRTADMVGRQLNFLSSGQETKKINDAGTEGGRQTVTKSITRDGQ